MLSSFRRGPAAVARLLSHASLQQPLTASPFLTRSLLQATSKALVARRGFHQSWPWLEQAVTQNALDDSRDSSISEQTAKLGPPKRFEELGTRGLVNRTVVRTLTDTMKLDQMTEVQSLTINETLKGLDVIAQAKTGTGKTLAFLIPVLQNIMEDPNLQRRARYGPPRTSASDIRALIISPTRELAEQIAAEARRLTKGTSVVVQTGVGGTQKRAHLQRMQREGCHILVGTPGRLKDIFSDPYSGVKAPKLSALVLDEADRLLEEGFQEELEDIYQLLPDKREVDRQTLMFSATVPREVMHLVQGTLKPDFKFLRTVHAGETPTHQRIPQKVVNVGGLENKFPTLLELVQREAQKSNEDPKTLPFKALVFFGTTKDTHLASSMFQRLRLPNADPDDFRPTSHPLGPMRILEIHGGLTQAQRTFASDTFRRATSGILFASDVVARGMDFPNVTHVIQCDLPRDHDTYVHRIGRTGRSNKPGEGWLLVSDLEARETTYRLKDIPLKPDNSLVLGSVDMTRDQELPTPAANILSMVGTAMQRIPEFDRLAAYKAQLGILQWVRPKARLVKVLSDLAKYSYGFKEAPAISPKLAQKMGFSRDTGFNIGSGMSMGGGGGGGFDSQSNDRFDRGRSWGDRDSRSGGFGYGGRDGGRDNRREKFGNDRSGFGRRDGNRYGDRNSGDRNFGDKFGDRNFGNKRFGDKKFGDKKFGDRGEGFGGRKPRSNGGGDFGRKFSRWGDRD
ncbi:MAG: hypothetical protein M1834_009692 [Cirrosporium novae-zelandiae]|nr:MAG: hypothetical protein M1834_009692 [Cirrosporium novae-zelandiae]